MQPPTESRAEDQDITVRKVRLVAFVASALAFPGGAAADGPPLLILSQPRGGRGVRVVVTGLNCARPLHGDELIWRDAYQYANNQHRRPADPPFRRIRVTRLSKTRVAAIFVVLHTDHPGRGIFTLFCGRNRNPFNTFTVTSRP
jgi:hypothetical protein